MQRPCVEFLVACLALLWANGLLPFATLREHLADALERWCVSADHPETSSGLSRNRSDLPRDRRPRFVVGQVVRDKIRYVQGVVVGWDLSSSAPEAWRAANPPYAQWNQSVHYWLALRGADLEPGASTEADFPNAIAWARDGTTSKIPAAVGYAPEPVLEASEGVLVYGPAVPSFFEFYDSELRRYIPRRFLLARYPEDVHVHYRARGDGGGPKRTPGGHPLKKVVSYPVPGRLVACADEALVGLEPGHFLVAEPAMRQEPFVRTVLLITRHDQEFTKAVIVNVPFERERAEAQELELSRFAEFLVNATGTDDRARGILLADTRALMALTKRPRTAVRLGGDVGLDQPPVQDYVTVLHPFGEVEGAALLLTGSGELHSPDIYLNGNLSQILAHAKHQRSASVLVFRGYAGWGPEQLGGEIRHHGVWSLAAASVPDILKPGERVAFWRRIEASSTKAADIAFAGSMPEKEH